MHMHKKHNGATPVLYVFVHLSYVMRSKESHVIFLQRAMVC